MLVLFPAQSVTNPYDSAVFFQFTLSSKTAFRFYVTYASDGFAMGNKVSANLQVMAF